MAWRPTTSAAIRQELRADAHLVPVCDRHHGFTAIVAEVSRVGAAARLLVQIAVLEATVELARAQAVGGLRSGVGAGGADSITRGTGDARLGTTLEILSPSVFTGLREGCRWNCLSIVAVTWQV